MIGRLSIVSQPTAQQATHAKLYGMPMNSKNHPKLLAYRIIQSNTNAKCRKLDCIVGFIDFKICYSNYIQTKHLLLILVVLFSTSLDSNV